MAVQAIALAMMAAACSDGAADSSAVEASVAATVEAMAAAEPTATPTPEPTVAPTPTPVPTVDPMIQINADRAEAEAFAVDFLYERDRKEFIEERMEANQAGLGMEGWLDNFIELNEDLEAGRITKVQYDNSMTLFNQGRERRREENAAFQEELLAMDTDGYDPEYELLTYFGETPGSPTVDLEDITAERLSLEIEAAAQARANAAT